MALPTFVNVGAKAAGTGAVTPALPASLATNDILLLFLEHQDGSAATPTIDNQNGGTWTFLGKEYTSNSGLVVYWSRYNGTQGDPTTSVPSNHFCVGIGAWRGCITSGNPWNLAQFAKDSGTTSYDIAGGTTTVADCLIIVAASSNFDLNTGQFSNWANADLSSVTSRMNYNTNAAQGGGFGVMEGGKDAAGTFGSTTVNIANTADGGSMVLALKPPISQQFIRTLNIGQSVNRASTY